MMSALQNWYDVLPEPKLQHISPQDFGFITGSINRLLVADISKLDPQLIFWIRNLYTDMTAFNVELTEIETYNWLRIKMENNDQNLMEFLSVYPHKLHVSHFNLLLPSTETRLVICQMEKAKLLPDRTSVIHLLHHYGHQNDLNSVLNIIFFTLYDLRINIDAQLIEAFIDALINSDEPKLAMYLLIQICSAYDEQTLPPAISLSESQVAVLDYLVSNFVNLEHAQLQQSIRPTAQMLRPFLKYYRSAREKDTLSALIQLVDKYDIEL
ncbi:hypothetical protein OGAPHI_006447 [Ogataea philodendri]|uniref:Uncharacterized protein n=1 Tax=Ogataea philodendri TaxID=1378263 RepID=A0A9P8NY55_9ASCO|nr:uncharacterized protein OGAPHI_006447 [Ogataea philodendri]KAH3661599.1 hypothetical protein OGAPHI_006447 [Ogataea philodendri]